MGCVLDRANCYNNYTGYYIETTSYSSTVTFLQLSPGSIFHVQVNSSENILEHALLYSIRVDLPVSRLGQLDQVLVIASPVNDVNLHAWDLNRVNRFFQLDIGLRVELCEKCVQKRQERSVTFIMEKMFISGCIKFLCAEAHILHPPVEENGFTVYNCPHTCFHVTPPVENSPPSYSEEATPPSTPEGIASNLDHDYDNSEFVQSLALSQSENRLKPGPPSSFHSPDSVWGDYSGSRSVRSDPIRIPTSESLFLADGTLSKTSTRTELHTTGSLSMATPYQINSRIIVTGNGDVQYEHNVLGNTPDQVKSESLPLQCEAKVEQESGGSEDIETKTVVVAPLMYGGGGDSDEDTPAKSTHMSAMHRPLSSNVPCPPHHTHYNTTNDLPPIASSHKMAATFPNSSAASSTLVTTLFSTQTGPATPTALAAPTTLATPTALPMSTGQVKYPFPPVMGRTNSDSRPNLSNLSSKERGQNRQSFHLDSKGLSTTNDFSADDYEEDCYVIIMPSYRTPSPSYRNSHRNSTPSYRNSSPSYRNSSSSSYRNSTPSYRNSSPCHRNSTPSYRNSTSSTSSLSPSFIKETQLLKKISIDEDTAIAGSEGHYVELLNDVFENDDKDSQLSLADAGKVIRQDWLESLEALRRSNTQSLSDSPTTPDSDKIGLSEVTRLERRNNIRASFLSCGDHHADEKLFQTYSRSRRNVDTLKSSSGEDAVSTQLGANKKEVTYRSSRTPSSHSQPQSITSAQQRVSLDFTGAAAVEQSHKTHTNQNLRPHSKRTEKPVVVPRKNIRKSTILADSSSVPRDTFHSSTRVSHITRNEDRVHREKEKGSMDYVENSIPSLRNRPIPLPRTGLGVRSSANTGTGQMSSSVSNLLDAAVSTDRLLPGGAHQPTLHRKFHSSTEINTSTEISTSNCKSWYNT